MNSLRDTFTRKLNVLKGMAPDLQFYQDVAGRIGRGAIDPDFRSGLIKEATFGTIGIPGDIGYLAGGVLPAVVNNWREGNALSQNIGDPLDYAYTSDALAAQAGMPFKNTGPEMAGRVVGGMVDIGAAPKVLNKIGQLFPDAARDGGDAARTAGKVGRQAGSIGGVKGAENLAKAGNDGPMNALRHAELADAKGLSPDAIWAETGQLYGYPAYRGPDGQWKFEIDDSAMEFNQDAFRPEMAKIFDREIPYLAGNLGEISKHREVLNAYPNMSGLPVSSTNDPSAAGVYHPGGLMDEQIGIDEGAIRTRPEYGRGILGHEMQHAIQHREGFAQGGSPRELGNKFENPRWAVWQNNPDAYRLRSILDSPEYSSELNAMNKLWLDKYESQFNELHKSRHIDEFRRNKPAMDAIIAEANMENARLFPLLAEADELSRRLGGPREPDQYLSGDAAYRRLAGEEEARAAKKRLNLTQPERIGRPIWEDFDTPMSDQIVRYGDGPNAMIGYHGSPKDSANILASGAGVGLLSGALYQPESEKKRNVLRNEL